MTAFGSLFREVLNTRGLTQTAAAELLHTTQSVISYYSNLERPPRRGTLLKIAEGLGVSIADLMGEPNGTATTRRRTSMPILCDVPTPPQPVCKVLQDLKRRWKRNHRERETIKHLLAALFPKDSDKMLAWLDAF